MKNKQWLILDLDSTLIKTFDNDEIIKLDNSNLLNDPKNYTLRSRFYDVSTREYVKDRLTLTRILGVYRPYLKQFLTYSFERFNVCVWTAGTYRYGHTIVDNISKGIARPLIVYTRENCTGPLHNLEKPIQKMIDENAGLKDYMNLNNTFVVDDRSCSISPNYDNGILIPPYDPDPTQQSIMHEDYRLLQLMEWFKKPEVIECKDVRDLKKDKIFESHINPGEYNQENMNIKNIIRMI